MDRARVETLVEEILALPGADRDTLARAVLPALLTTPASVAALDEALARLSDPELAALVERARLRSRHLTDATVSAIIDEALRTARAESRS